MARRVLMLLASVAVAMVGVSAPAHAANGWAADDYGGGVEDFQTCTAVYSADNASWKLCLEYSSDYTYVRGKVYADAHSPVTLTADLRRTFKDGSSGQQEIACAGAITPSMGNVQCVTAWVTTQRIVQTTYADFTINGVSTPQMYVMGMKSVDQVQQGRTWCGPGAVHNALADMNGSSPSQATLASYMGTDTLGTNPWDIQDALNNWKPGIVGMTYHWIHETMHNNNAYDVAHLVDQARQSMENGAPVVFLVDANQLPWWDSSAGIIPDLHYITVHGYAATKYPNGAVDADGSPWHVDNYAAFDPAFSIERSISQGPLVLAAFGALDPVYQDEIHMIAAY